MKIKVVMPAGAIPDGSHVTKKTGTAPYTLRTEIVIYPDRDGKQRGEKQVIKSEDVRYLVGSFGDINAVAATRELMWHVEDIDLVRHLRSRDPDDEWYEAKES